MIYVVWDIYFIFVFVLVIEEFCFVGFVVLVVFIVFVLFV